MRGANSADGTVSASELYQAAVFNRAKLTYDGVSAWLDGDALDIPFPDDTFDVAVMPLVIFFVPDPARGVGPTRQGRCAGLVGTYLADAGTATPEEVQASLAVTPDAGRDLLVVDVTARPETSVEALERAVVESSEFVSSVTPEMRAAWPSDRPARSRVRAASSLRSIRSATTAGGSGPSVRMSNNPPSTQARSTCE